MKKVAFIMGSASDLPVVKKGLAVLKQFGVPAQARILSAHRTPQAAHDFAKQAKAQGFGVLIACAGKAAHLAGSIAACTTLPVIGVPVAGGSLGGLDALLSTVQMPKGIPVATVALDGAENAALLAISILSLSEPKLDAALDAYRTEQSEAVLAQDGKLQAEDLSFE